MKKTFLLGTKPSLYIFLAILFLSNAIVAYFNPEQSRLEYWLMIVNAITGLFCLLFILFVLTDLTGTAPKVVVTNEGVLLKAKVFGSGRQIKWSEVSSMIFHSYQIDFKLDSEPVFFSYKASANVSRDIKQAIRDMADMKNIPITGG